MSPFPRPVAYQIGSRLLMIVVALERLSKPLEGVGTDERTGERQEGVMDIRAPFVADLETTILMKPGEGPFNDPPVAAQPSVGVDLDPRDSADDPTLPQARPAARIVIGFVTMQLPGAPPPPTAGLFDRRNGIDHGFEEARFLAISAGRGDDQGEARLVGEQVVLGARFAPIDGVTPRFGSPFLARTLLASMTARSQAIWPVWPSRSSSARWRRSHTPACCQSRRRRQQVMPLPQPISCGKYSQGIPVLRTKMIPARQARSGMRGRPPLGFGGSGGNNGSRVAQRSSGTNGLAIIHLLLHPSGRFCSRVLFDALKGLSRLAGATMLSRPIISYLLVRSRSGTWLAVHSSGATKTV